MNRLCRNGSRRLLLSIGRRQRQTCAVFSRSPHANTNDSQTNTHASIHAHSKLAYIAQWFFEPSLVFTPSRSGRKIFGSSASSWLSEPSLVFHSVVNNLIMSNVSINVGAGASLTIGEKHNVYLVDEYADIPKWALESCLSSGVTTALLFR